MIYLIFHTDEHGKKRRSVVEAVTEDGAKAALKHQFPDDSIQRTKERKLSAPRVLETIYWPANLRHG